MIEVTGDLWTYKTSDGKDPDVRVITTNGTVKKNGECVMGRGCAFEAKQRWLQIPHLLGDLITRLGNHVNFLGELKNADLVTTFQLWSFPVKHNWYERADLALIEQSAKELVSVIDEPEQIIALPRPGCGNGSLNWDDVRPVIAPILDDRFHVITFK